MNFSNNKIDNFIMLSPLLGESAPILIDLWKAQMAWASLAGVFVTATLGKLYDESVPTPEDYRKS
jgi:hypothetical protein